MNPEFGGNWEAIERALRESQCLAVAGQFGAAIMHEINNPLEAISNLNFLCQKDAGNPDKVRDYSRLIEEQMQQVVKIARQTLSFYHSTDTLERVELASVADAALRLHHRKISSKQIQLVKRLSSDATSHVHAGEMLQVFSNLIANALDALPTNGKLCLRVSSTGREVHVVIADDGHGIPRAIHARIFDPFFTTKKESGTGLGLAISKAIVERHRGKITIRSSVRAGKSGTAFRVSLPSDYRNLAVA